MKNLRILAALFSMSLAGFAHAADPTAAGLTTLGWTCLTVGTNVACTAPGEANLREINLQQKRPASVLVMIFNAVRPEFIGSENLIRADLYAGQACPKVGRPGAGRLEPYKFEMLGAGYFSCHHFEREVEL
jgi:hypothetical protein